MKSSSRSNKSVDINIINNLLNYELRTNKIIRPSMENINFKILIPCVAAGAIIGKGGEAIAVIQKETGAKVKISKSYDFYPGTTERICLIMGALDSVIKVHDYIIDRIQEKPDQLAKQVIDGKGVVERHKQVKILVPNSTAGMIIGKSGCYIKEIKEKSGSFVQISQKSKEINLPERCVTIAGDRDQNRGAVQMILCKICEDPHSASCPTISYVDILGPVASAYPTGSPYAMIGNNFTSSNTIPPISASPQSSSSSSSSSSTLLMANSNTISSTSSSTSSNTGLLNHYSTNHQSSSSITNDLSYMTPLTNAAFLSSSPTNYNITNSTTTGSLKTNLDTISYYGDPSKQTTPTNELISLAPNSPANLAPQITNSSPQSVAVPQTTSLNQESNPVAAAGFIRNILKISGFSNKAADDITKSIEILCQYGLTNCPAYNSNKNSLTNAIIGNSTSSSNNLLIKSTTVSLYDSAPLYGALDDSQTNFPLDFLINSYLNHCTNFTIANTTVEDSILLSSEILTRYIEITEEQLEFLGSLDTPFVMKIKSKTNCDIQLDKDKSRPNEGIYTLKVMANDLDDILDAIGMIIYYKNNKTNIDVEPIDTLTTIANSA